MNRLHRKTTKKTEFVCRTSGLWRKVVCLSLIMVSGVLAGIASAQNRAAPGSSSVASAFLTAGLENTQFPLYADNALGFDAGLSLQIQPLIGLEVRLGAYPVSARFDQMPFTGGYRIGTSPGRAYSAFASAGGGVSRSEGETVELKATSPQWRPCVQTDAGIDRNFSRVSVRILQVSYRTTFAPEQNLRTFGVSMGLVYHFTH